jgi:hypothetical protein
MAMVKPVTEVAAQMFKGTHVIDDVSFSRVRDTEGVVLARISITLLGDDGSAITKILAFGEPFTLSTFALGLHKLAGTIEAK